MKGRKIIFNEVDLIFLKLFVFIQISIPGINDIATYDLILIKIQKLNINNIKFVNFFSFTINILKKLNVAQQAEDNTKLSFIIPLPQNAIEGIHKIV